MPPTDVTISSHVVSRASLGSDAMRYVTVGLGVLAGAALLEAALIPGIVIGGAAVLAPPLVRRKLQQGVRSLFNATTAPLGKPTSPAPAPSKANTSAALLVPRF